MKFDKVLMETAKLWSKQSYCERRQVGAVIARDGRILATGFNGTISGTDNKCEDKFIVCPKCGRKYIHDDAVLHENTTFKITCSCGAVLSYTEDYINKLNPTTNDFTLHAEQNALMFCAKHGISVEDCTIYITTSPCKHCTKLIAQSGIKRVVYLEEYKDTSGLELLAKIGIDTEKYIEK